MNENRREQILRDFGSPAPPLTPEQIADKAVGYCQHITVGHSHDWACAPCIAAIVRLYAAEERGRRRGVEKRDAALRQAHEFCLYMFRREWLTAPENRNIFAARIFAILDAALAPRDSVPEPARMDATHGPTCWCGMPSRHESGWCGTCNLAKARK